MITEKQLIYFREEVRTNTMQTAANKERMESILSYGQHITRKQLKYLRRLLGWRPAAAFASRRANEDYGEVAYMEQFSEQEY